MYTTAALLLVISIIFSGTQALSWTGERVGADGCTTMGICPISSPVVPIEPTTSTHSMLTSESLPLSTSVFLQAEDFFVEATVAHSTGAMVLPPSTSGSEYINPATSVEMTAAVSTQRVILTASAMATTILSSTTSGAPVMSTSSLTSCTTICPPTTTVEPTNPTTKHETENPTTGSPTNAPATGSNVGLAVGLTLLALVIVTVVCVLAAIFIYRRYGKYRTSYEVLPTDK